MQLIQFMQFCVVHVAYAFSSKPRMLSCNLSHSKHPSIKWCGRDSNPGPLSLEFSAITTRSDQRGRIPKLQADVHAVGPLVAGELYESFLILESYRNGEVVDGTTLHDTSNVLCKCEANMRYTD